MSILKRQVSSSSNFSLFFSVITHNSSVIFRSYIFYFGQKDLIKLPILTLPSVLVKICQIPHVIFQTTSQFFFKFCMTLHCHERLFLCTIFRSSVIYFPQKEPMNVKIFKTFECSDQNSPSSCHF